MNFFSPQPYERDMLTRAGQFIAAFSACMAWLIGGCASPKESAFPRIAQGVEQRWTAEPVFAELTFDDPVSMVQAPGSERLFVAEREGRLFSFEQRQDVTEKKLVLDLSAETQGHGDSGLLGLAFHPKYGEKGRGHQYLYVAYAFTETPIQGRPVRTTETWSRVSRFTLSDASGVVDPASEVVLINQRDQDTWHQGGALLFGADGFLYISMGDEGGEYCQYENCQLISKDLFAGVLRIDVAQRGGDISHPPPRQPEDGQT